MRMGMSMVKLWRSGLWMGFVPFTFTFAVAFAFAVTLVLTNWKLKIGREISSQQYVKTRHLQSACDWEELARDATEDTISRPANASRTGFDLRTPSIKSTLPRLDREPDLTPSNLLDE